TAVRPIALVSSTSAIDRQALELASQHRADGALGDDRAHGVVAPGQRLQDRVGPLGHPGEDALRAELVVDRLVAGDPEDDWGPPIAQRIHEARRGGTRRVRPGRGGRASRSPDGGLDGAPGHGPRDRDYPRSTQLAPGDPPPD